MNRLGISVLGSGSKGNSILLHNEESGILIDAGFSRKDTFGRLLKLGIRKEIIKGILISHEHTDHVTGAKLISESLEVPVYGTSLTLKCLIEKNKLSRNVIVFESGSPFNIDNFEVWPFVVPHDAVDPVGFIVKFHKIRIGIAMDLGHLNRLCLQKLSGCEVLILESNHDVEMQVNSERNLMLIKRVMGRHGHLNNDDAINAFDQLIGQNTRCLFLSHLSEECNNDELVYSLARAKLAEIKREDVCLFITRQSEPSPTFWFDYEKDEVKS